MPTFAATHITIRNSNEVITIAEYEARARAGHIETVERVRIHRTDGRPMDVTSLGERIMEVDAWGNWRREARRAGAMLHVCLLSGEEVHSFRLVA